MLSFHCKLHLLQFATDVSSGLVHHFLAPALPRGRSPAGGIHLLTSGAASREQQWYVCTSSPQGHQWHSHCLHQHQDHCKHSSPRSAPAAVTLLVPAAGSLQAQLSPICGPTTSDCVPLPCPAAMNRGPGPNTSSAGPGKAGERQQLLELVHVLNQRGLTPAAVFCFSKKR